MKTKNEQKLLKGSVQNNHGTNIGIFSLKISNLKATGFQVFIKIKMVHTLYKSLNFVESHAIIGA